MLEWPRNEWLCTFDVDIHNMLNQTLFGSDRIDWGHRQNSARDRFPWSAQKPEMSPREPFQFSFRIGRVYNPR